MGRRKKRLPRSAYLKKTKRFYDPYSPYALRMRGAKVLRLDQPIPPSLMESEPRRAAKAAALEWQSLRFQKLTEFHRIVLHEIKDRNGNLSEGFYIFWHADEYYIYRISKAVQCRSKKYTRQQAYDAYYEKNGQRVFWAEVYRTPPPAVDSA